MNWKSRIVGHAKVPPDQLVANPYNHRLHPQTQRDALSAAIKEVGFIRSVTVNQRTGNLIDGHERVWQALQGEESEIDVEYVDLSEEEEKKALALLDRIGEMAEVDPEALDALLREIETGEEVLQELLAGMAEDAGLDYMQGEPPEAPEAEIDRAAELNQKWGVKRGDVWVIGEHRLMCGDSTSAEDVGVLMGGEKAGLIVTSPPYNQKIDKFKPSGMHKEGDWVGKVGRLAYADSMPEEDYREWQSNLLNLCHSVLGDGGSFFYNHKNRYRDKRVLSPLEWLPGPFALRQEIVWSRPGSVTQNARMFLPSDERIYWMYKGDDFKFSGTTEIKSWSTVWRIGLETNRDHAVGFPVELPFRCIKACSENGDIVFEPYCGSGTTMVAAEQLGRRCFGMEISENYSAVILERMAQMGLEGKKNG